MLQNLIRRGLVVALFFLFVATPTARAGSTTTNWDGLVYQLILPKTNLVAGEKIRASMVISNAVDRERAFDYKWGDPCRTSFGDFLIFVEPSTTPMDCVIPMEERVRTSASIDPLRAYQSKESTAELTKPFALTNAGIYRVQAVGVFRYLDSPESSFTLITPPITLSISNATKANAAARE